MHEEQMRKIKRFAEKRKTSGGKSKKNNIELNKKEKIRKNVKS
jgi:hypothetical protein